MTGWELGDVDALIESTLANDSTIQSLMGVSPARVANYRVPSDLSWKLLYIYFYSIPGNDIRVQGNGRVMTTVDYDIEVRTTGAPTDNSRAIVARIDVLIGAMKRQLTANSQWVVCATPLKPINILQSGESSDVFYVRQGRTYAIQVVQGL